MATTERTIGQPQTLDVIRPTDSHVFGYYDEKIFELYAAYGNHDNATACRALLELLQLIEADKRIPNASSKADMGRAIAAFLNVFSSPDLEVPEKQAFYFLYFNALIGNATAGCLKSDTQPWIQQLAGQKQEAFKAAVLTSARNRDPIGLDVFMSASPELASAWFCQTFKQGFSANVNWQAAKNLRTFCEDLDDDFLPARDLQEPYFLCSYLDNIHVERNCKTWINRAINFAITKPIDNGRPKKRIGIATDYWLPGHSVYRTLKGFIDALAPEYELILFHAIRPADELDTTGFTEVVRLHYDGERLDTTNFNGHNLSALIYPDIGMTAWSIIASNYRIAPVQVMMTGHPSSTFGSEIDYFISGELVESPHHQENYSEELVLLPGYGAIHQKPTYKPKGRNKDYHGVLINCSWYGQKISANCLTEINQAVEELRRHRHYRGDVKLRIFAGNAPVSHAGYAAFMDDVASLAPSVEVELVTHQPYDEYMAMMEEGDFAVDVFPFAGSNTVSDNLHLGKPVLIMEGDRWFNRIGAAMQRDIGLNFLCITRKDCFRRVLGDLIMDETFRQNCCDIIEAADMDATIYANRGAAEFRKFMDKTIREKTSPEGTKPTQTAVQDETR